MMILVCIFSLHEEERCLLGMLCHCHKLALFTVAVPPPSSHDSASVSDKHYVTQSYDSVRPGLFLHDVERVFCLR